MSFTAEASKYSKPGKMPKVIWHPKGKQFYTILGNHKGRRGKVVRAYHYLGEIQGAAEANDKRIHAAWESLRFNELQKALLGSQISGKNITPEPLWPEDEKERQKLIDRANGGDRPANCRC